MTTIFDRFRPGAIPPEDPQVSDKKPIEGRIIKLSDQGYGFIISKEISFTRIFFHWTSLKQETLHFKQLHKGMRVEFVPIEVPGKGWRAIKIKIIEDKE